MYTMAGPLILVQVSASLIRLSSCTVPHLLAELFDQEDSRETQRTPISLVSASSVGSSSREHIRDLLVCQAWVIASRA